MGILVGLVKQHSFDDDDDDGESSLRFFKCKFISFKCV
jgi:hypothetical protein